MIRLKLAPALLVLAGAAGLLATGPPPERLADEQGEAAVFSF